MKYRRALGPAAATIVGLFIGGPLLAGAASVGEAVGQEVQANTESAVSQKKIDQLSDDTEALAAEYRAALQSTRSLQVYNRQL